MKEKISISRVLSILGIVASALGAALGISILNNIEFDKMLCILFVILGFMPVLVFELGYERRRNLIGNNNQTSYGRMATGFFISAVLLVGMSFMPAFYRPILLLPLIMVAFSNETLGTSSGMFLSVILLLATDASLYEAVLYIMLIVIGGVLAKSLSQVDYRGYISVIFASVNILLPNIFYYLVNEEIDLSNLGICAVNAFVIAVYGIVLYPKMKEETLEEISYSYKRFLEDNFMQVQWVRGYSRTEYRHARKVSEIAGKYAKNLGLKEDLAAAAGFYYRLGRWEGEPFIENALKKGQDLCFPEEMLQILKEYYGEEQLPSTPESALVHIVDGLLIKLELLEKEVGTSQWNREVVIYQTLNEFSTAGLYDKSGLSINAFIKIREWLAKEELL